MLLYHNTRNNTRNNTIIQYIILIIRNTSRRLSYYLRHVGLGARAGVSAVQVLQMVGLLEEALALLEQIAQQQAPAQGDGLVILARLQRIEQLLVMLAPVPFVARTSAC